MKKRGMTLMELLVYMAIVGIVVMVAGTAFTNSTKMRIRTEGMLKASASAEDIGTLFRDDVAQMGAKSAVNATSRNAFSLQSDVYMPTASGSTVVDYSSFNYFKDQLGVGLDSLAFRRIKYNSNGSFKRVEEISWYATTDGVLHRTCVMVPTTSIAGTADEECPEEDPLEVDIAEGVTKFVITPATPGVVQSDYSTASNTKQFPSLLPSNTDASVESFRLLSRYGEDGYAFVSTSPAAGGSSIVVSNFASNYKNGTIVSESDVVANQVYVAPASNAEGSWKTLCTKIDSLSVGVEYELSFSLPYIDNSVKTFCPGRDHMAVGFRKKTDGSKVAGLEDFLFYPPATSDASTNRNFKFSVASKVTDVCLAFTFATFSPVASEGYISINSLKLQKVAASNYSFVDGYVPASVADKKNIKAFRLEMKILKDKEAGEVSLVVPTPSNGSVN